MGDLTLKDLLEAGVHFGHQTKRWNPKMRPYIFMEKNGIHIIDLQKTLDAVTAAREAVRKTAEGGKQRGYDSGKKIAGRKRHLAVDTLGLVLAVIAGWLLFATTRRLDIRAMALQCRHVLNFYGTRVPVCVSCIL